MPDGPTPPKHPWGGHLQEIVGLELPTSRAVPASLRGTRRLPTTDDDVIDMTFDSDGESIQDVTGELILDLTLLSDGDSDSASDGDGSVGAKGRKHGTFSTTMMRQPLGVNKSSSGLHSPWRQPVDRFDARGSPSSCRPNEPPAGSSTSHDPFSHPRRDEPPRTSGSYVNPLSSHGYRREASRASRRGDQADSHRNPTRLQSDLGPSHCPSAEAEEENFDPSLSEQQQDILRRCMAGENIFFTGSAGTGKSVLLRALIRSLRSRSGDGDIGVTASTGMAALNIGGCTLHSWAGIGLGTGTAAKLCTFMNSRARKRWRESRTLLVDEISMLDGELLDKLDQIGRYMRHDNKAPFGGLQVIFCGDFFQLPPVSKDKEVPFAFESKVWDQLFPVDNMVTLKNVFRQSDSRFVDCLESMRRGVVTEEHDNLLKSLDRPLDTSNGTRPVALYSRRIDVDRQNMKNLGAIKSRIEQYDAIDRAHELPDGRGLTQAQATQKLNDRSRWPENLPLKVGAQVMLVTNWMPGLVNGSTGTVTAFMSPEDARNAGVKVPDEFYDDDPQDIPSSPQESQMHRRKRRDLPEELWPVVNFPPHRNSPRDCPDTILVPRMVCTMENADNEVEASRFQVPLILAWAITIHKSQGLTLDKVRVDLGGAFDCGQAYVAISRATSLQGLELRGYTRAKIMTSDTVLQWSREMEWDELASHMVLDY